MAHESGVTETGAALRYRQGVEDSAFLVGADGRPLWGLWQATIGNARFLVFAGEWTDEDARLYLLGVWERLTGHTSTIRLAGGGTF